MRNKSNDVYFANLEGSELLDALKTRVSDYRNYYKSSGLEHLWRTSLGSYYGISKDGKLSWEVTRGGEAGELVQQKVNEYASYVKHQVVLAVKDRPAGIAKAINNDIKTLRNSQIGSQVVEYYLSDPGHNFEDDYIRSLRMALLVSEANVVMDWDQMIGKDVRPEPSEDGSELPQELDENGRPIPPKMIKQGDIVQDVFGPWDSARDLGAPNFKAPWRIFSRRTNKFELAAKFSAYEKEILIGASRAGITAPFYEVGNHPNSDYIEEFIFIHLPTFAVPEGKLVRFTADAKFFDGAFPYGSSNIFTVRDEDLIGGPHGHTPNYNLLGLEQVTDMLHSVILNNQSTFGVATILAAKGAGFVQQILAKGMRFLEVDSNYFEKIKTLDLVRTAPEIFAYLTSLSSKKGEMSGINSVLRGDPQGALKGASGSAMALLQSQSIDFNSSIQKSYYSLLSAAGTGIISLSQKFADSERVATLAGKSNAQAVKEFKYDGKTLESVSTVVFTPVNPVMQTPAGKVAAADNMLEKGLITSPKRYIEVYTTGNLESLIGDDVDMQEAIIEENEWLSEGRPVQAVATENHEDHIKSHGAVLAKPNAKDDPELVARVLEHQQEHIEIWQQLSVSNPALLLATGQKVLPQVPPPPGAPVAPGPGGGPPGSAPMNPASSNPGQPNLPNPPTNPATGEAAPVAPGTTVKAA